MSLWLAGAQSQVKAVFLLKWSKTGDGRVRGMIELYKLNRQGMPRLHQSYPILIRFLLDHRFIIDLKNVEIDIQS